MLHRDHFAFPSFIPAALRTHHISMRPPRMDTAQLTLVRQPFDHPDFLFELKHDGFRALAHIWSGKCELVSRRRNPYKTFQALRNSLAKLKVNNAVIDGELVCLDAEGRSIFNELLHRKGFPAFYAFDLLSLNGRDLRQLPLIERKEKLRAILDKSELPDVICEKYLEERGVDLFNEVCQRNLEGVVAKRKTGTYCTISGWLKIKNPNYTQSERRHELFEAFKTKSIEPQRNLPPIPKKPPQRAITVPKKVHGKLPSRAGRSGLPE
jgi:ATP-dependent DNA ligase